MTMAKVVQFLEIGNLPKSQLNACPYRKVMIKNLFLSISKSGSARNFHTIFEFSLQISRSHGPPVFRLSHMVQTISILNLNRDEIQMISEMFLNFVCRFAAPKTPLSYMAMIVAIWDSLKTGGASTANEIR